MEVWTANMVEGVNRQDSGTMEVKSTGFCFIGCKVWAEIKSYFD
jgi:hypothetical protein